MRYSRAIDKKSLPSPQQQMTKATPVNNCDSIFVLSCPLILHSLRYYPCLGSSSSSRNWSVCFSCRLDWCFFRLIIEQQYHQAVSVIKRTLAFLESIKDLGVENLDSPSPDREIGIGAQVQKRSLHLAEILRDSLVRLPNSEVSLLPMIYLICRTIVVGDIRKNEKITASCEIRSQRYCSPRILHWAKRYYSKSFEIRGSLWRCWEIYFRIKSRFLYSFTRSLYEFHGVIFNLWFSNEIWEGEFVVC